MKKVKYSVKNRILLAVVAFLSIFLIFNLLHLFCKLYNMKDYFYDYDSLIQTVEQGDYSSLSYMLENNDNSHVKPENDISDFYLLMDFYESANMYDIYALRGDKEKASQQAEILEELKSRMKDGKVINAADKLLCLYDGVKTDFHNSK